MMDIVERLRKKKEQYIIHVDYGIGVYEELADSDTPDADCIEAANEIERLRKELEAESSRAYHRGHADGEDIGYKDGLQDGYNDGLEVGRAGM